MVSSKKQVKEKGRGQWSPVKVSTQSREPPPLPPLVSDRCSQLEKEGEEGDAEHVWFPGGVLAVSRQPRCHLLKTQGSHR